MSFSRFRGRTFLESEDITVWSSLLQRAVNYELQAREKK